MTDVGCGTDGVVLDHFSVIGTSVKNGNA